MTKKTNTLVGFPGIGKKFTTGQKNNLLGAIFWDWLATNLKLKTPQAYGPQIPKKTIKIYDQVKNIMN